MNIYLFHYVLSLSLTSLTSLVLGLFVYFKNKRSRVNQSFLLFSLSMALWSGFQTGVGSTNNTFLTSFCMYPEHVGVIFIPSTFIYFIYNFLEIKRKWLIRTGFALSLFFLLLLPAKWFIKGLGKHMVLNHSIKPGPLYIGLVVFLVSYMIWGLVELFKAYRLSTGAKRNQMKYLFWGLLLAIITGVSNFLYLYDIKLPLIFPLTNYGVPLYVFATAYAIVKYRLMDISVVIKRTVIYGIIYSFSIGIFAFIILFFGQWLIAGSIDKRIFWLSMLALFLITIMVRPLDNLLTRVTDKLLFRKKYEYQKTLKEASAGMATVRNIDKLLNLIVSIITKHVRVTHATIFLSDAENLRFQLRASKGRTKLSLDVTLAKDEPLIWWLNKKRSPVVQDELNSLVKFKTPEQDKLTIKKLETTIEKMRELKTSVCVPCFFEGKLIGFLLLGEKLSGDMYTREDLNLFMTLSNHAASAIKNCLAYEELKEKDKLLLEAEKLAAVGRLASNIAHEIKNPLAPIKTYTEFLDEKIDDPDFRHDFKKVIVEEVNRINHIVQALIDYAHPKKLNRTAVDVRQIINDTLHLLENDLVRQDIKVIKDYDPNSHTILADREQLKQVFLNLFLNSIQALKNISQRCKELRVLTSPNKGSISIKIQDTGCGIKKEDLPFIFDPFFSTKEKGSGLGLSIVQSIIKNHEGIISVESNLGEGATFYINLPYLNKK